MKRATRVSVTLASVAMAAALAFLFLSWPGDRNPDSGGNDDAPGAGPTETIAARESPPSPGPTVTVASDSAPSLTQPLAWPRMTRRDFGCLLQREGGRKEPWNCETPAESLESPCADAEGHFRGPQFPPEFVSRVSPLVAEISLHWEHRQLQEMEIRFRAGVEEAAIFEAFAIPRTLHVARENIVSVDLHECGADARCLTLRGFERGDVDCGDGRRPD